MTAWTLFESALAQTLLGALWQDAWLAVLAALVLAAMARRTAAARHAVGLLLLLAMVLWPAWQMAALLVGDLPVAAPAPTGAELAPPWLAPPWLAWAWCAGVAVMSARLGGGWWLLRRLESQPLHAPVPPHWQRRVDALRLALGIARPVALRLLRGAGQPFSARAWRPVIWMPLGLLTQLPAPMIEALIAHELAHVRRLDWVWNGLQCGIETLLFFHPGVWWLSRRVRVEREHACDDLAAAVCRDPLVLAEALDALARVGGTVPMLALAAKGGPLVQRVQRLLAPGRPAGPRWSGLAAGLALLAAGSVLAAQGVPVAPATPPAPVVAASPALPAVPPATSIDAPREPWWTRVGESTWLKIHEGGHLHDYHAWVDLGGDRHETYRIDGRDAPLDAAARQWVAAHRAPPQLPPPPAPLRLPAPPPPPIPPMPPIL